MAKHLVDLYQVSIKGKSNQIETNFINGQETMDPNDPYQVSLQEANNQIDDNFIDSDGAIPLTYFDIFDFFEDPCNNPNFTLVFYYMFMV